MPIAVAVKSVNWLLPLRNGAAEFLQFASRSGIRNQNGIGYGCNEMITSIGPVSSYAAFVFLKGGYEK